MLARSFGPVALLALLPNFLSAQIAPSAALEPGRRVRFTSCIADSAGWSDRSAPNRRDRATCLRYAGNVVRRAGDSVVIAHDGSERGFALTDIQRMEVRTGTRGNWAAGMAIGGAVGLAWGIVSAAAEDCSEQFLQDLCQAGQVLQPLAGAAIGGGLGALVGGLIRSDRWTAVSVRVVGSRGGRRLAGGLVVSF
jgi:hypothetical protein